ncbi:MAG: GNAT family N-acetyltransferase [Candidatus Hodarchaeales archaeon]
MSLVESVYFRKARKDEISYLKEIVHLSYQIIVETLSRPPGAIIDTIQKLRRTYQKSGLFVIETSDKEIIGTFSLGTLDERTTKLYHFAIHPEFQKKGYGSKILVDIIDFIPTIHPKAEFLYVEVYNKTPYLLRFYNKFGFEQKSEIEINNEIILKLLRPLHRK